MRKRYRSVKLLYGLLLSLFVVMMSVSMDAYADETGTVYSVTGNVTNLTFSGAAQATGGQDYVATIANNGGCQPPDRKSVV